MASVARDRKLVSRFAKDNLRLVLDPESQLQACT